MSCSGGGRFGLLSSGHTPAHPCCVALACMMCTCKCPLSFSYSIISHWDAKISPFLLPSLTEVGSAYKGSIFVLYYTMLSDLHLSMSFSQDFYLLLFTFIFPQIIKLSAPYIGINILATFVFNRQNCV